MYINTSSYVLRGAMASSPILPGTIPFGIITGVAAIQAGLTPLQAQISPMILAAGASQIAASQLIATGTIPLMIILTIWIINLRFMMYSAALTEHNLALSPLVKFCCGFVLSDQAYALSHIYFEQNELTAQQKTHYFLGSAFTLWFAWQFSNAIGIFFGTTIPPSWGLDFSIPLCFIAILIPTIKNRPSLLAAIVGGTLAVLLHNLPYNLGLLLGAIAGIGSGFYCAKILTLQESNS